MSEGLLKNLDRAINDTNRVLNIYQKPVIDATNKWSSFSSGTSLVSSQLVKNSAGTLRHFHGFFVPPATDGYTFLQIHNATALPSNGATAFDSFILPYFTNEKPFNFDWNITDLGIYFTTGIVLALSSTATTLTLYGTNSMFIQGLYL
jgi:hypothetical protein